MKTKREIVINFRRVNSPLTRYTEGLVMDDGQRLVTYSIIAPQYALPWSQRWIRAGLIPVESRLNSVKKHHFYDQHFTILEYRDLQDTLLGYYCDISTPLRWENGEYFIDDWLLDLWIGVHGEIKELDRDEFEAAYATGKLSTAQYEKANATLAWLKEQTLAGNFPAPFLDY